MTSPAIQVSHLHKTFCGRAKALDDISLNIQAGEMVALIGASGSGKSTLIRHIAGLLVGDRGGASQLIVLDRQLQGAGRLARDIRQQRARIGVVFQQFNLVGRMTVLGNVLVGTLGHIPMWRGALGLFSRSERLKAIRALGRVGLAELATQRASTLSGGQQQRVAIARTLVQDAEIILADEPIASLDPESARRVMDILARINQEDGRTVVVSLHQVDFALKYCHRTVALQNGQICYDGPSRELTPNRLKTLYGTTIADSEADFPSLDPALLANLAAPTITHSTPAHPAVSVESV